MILFDHPIVEEEDNASNISLLTNKRYRVIANIAMEISLEKQREKLSEVTRKFL